MRRHPCPSPRRRVFAVLLVAALLGLQGLSMPTASAARVQTEEAMVPSGSGPDAVELDTTLYIPDSATDSDPAPAVILAHGYGGTKQSVSNIAGRLADSGYVVMTYTARGFGNSTGMISIDAPDYEIADARTLIDVLAERPEVIQDGPGDPRVGIYGRSYGGGLTLLTAGYDQRVDAIAAGSTWNSLISALFPNDLGAPAGATPAAGPEVAEDGVFKRLWAEQLFTAGEGVLPDGTEGSTGNCGNYRPEVCAALSESASTGRLTPELADLLAASSPASVVDRITAPTLLTQGEGDTLFTLAEADATARALSANGTTVKMIWYTGGHGAKSTSGDTRVQLQETAAWFDFYLRGEGEEPADDFGYSLFTQATDGNTAPDAVQEQLPAYPGLGSADGGARTEIALDGGTQELTSPDGGSPAALSAIPPGLQLDEGEGRNSEVPAEVSGQTATFQTPAFAEDTRILGSPTVSVRVASSSGAAVLFGKLYDVDPDGNATLLLGLVSPYRLDGLSDNVDSAEPVTLTLPALAQSIPAGHSLQVSLASTDQAYVDPTGDEATYQVALADSGLSMPQLSDAGTVVNPPGGGSGGGGRSWLPIVGVVLLVAVAALIVVVTTRLRASR